MSDVSCPQSERLRDCLVGRVPAEAAEALLDHLDRCPRCQTKLQTVRDADDTLIDYLRQPRARDEYLDEPQFQEALARAARAKAIGQTLLLADQATGSGEAKSDIVGQLDQYQILEKLVDGGMGTVYRALHTKLDRVVAVKVLPVDGSGRERAIARFEQEMRAVGHLDHPHIVRALDAREVQGTRFLVLGRCTICMETFGNGAQTGTRRTTTLKLRASIRRVFLRARPASFAAARGATRHVRSGRPSGAACRPTIGTTVSASGWPPCGTTNEAS